MSRPEPRIPLPKSWPTHVRAAILHVISLAQFATALTRGWAANSIHARIRWKAERDQAWEEVARLREEIRIKDARMGAINPPRRPYYPPTERMAILELKIAQTWARAGLHLAATTVGRMLKEDAAPRPRPAASTTSKGHIVTAEYRDHVWHIDLTVAPTGLGLWCSWLPFALPQQYPCCWWLGVVLDHFSRRAMGIGVFANHPNCQQFCTFMGRTIGRTAKPKYIVCDRDKIFDCPACRRWVRRRGIKPPRYGKAGEQGSVAVVERFILSWKLELTRRILVPLRRDALEQQLLCYRDWLNEHRPHTTLGGRTPNEAYYGRRPLNRRPRVEPRRR